MMASIFYFFAIFAILFELVAFQNPQRILDKEKHIRETKNDNDVFKHQYAIFSLLMLLYILWNLIGLFSSQWFLFGLLLLLGLIFKGRKYVWHVRLYSFLTLVILIFIILNKYYLHLELPKVIINIF